MPATFNKGSDVRLIMQSLPADQIKHSYNVKRYVDIITAILCHCDPYSELIRKEKSKCFGRAAFYHDIGKAWVPTEILTKPGKLTAEEIFEIKKHPQYSEQLFELILDGSISGMPAYLIRPAHDAAVYHHEWWNGKGYPYGISKERIPLIARITSICDVYDAITSDRPYRKARSHDYACGEIRKSAETQFDPGLAKVFLDHETEIFDLYTSLNEMRKCC
jgi:HD-GYP domain-containing protein (c-di-GMP phosphodiesterase class II)